MEELKFSYAREENIPNTPVLPGIFSGPYKFATQHTAVYDDYVLVDTGSEILKLDAKCDRAFASGDRIGLLCGRKLDVYAGLLHCDTYNFSGDGPAGRLFDLLPDERLQEYARGACEDGVFCFMAGGHVLEVSASEVLFRGKREPNTIHEEGAEYFVAHKDPVTVVGNSKSFGFIYFLGADRNEPEECFSLSLRVDEDFETVYARDMKFCGELLLLKDADKNVYYGLEGLKAGPAKPVVGCKVTERQITKGSEIKGAGPGAEKPGASTEFEVSAGPAVGGVSGGSSGKEQAPDGRDAAEDHAGEGNLPRRARPLSLGALRGLLEPDAPSSATLDALLSEPFQGADKASVTIETDGTSAGRPEKPGRAKVAAPGESTKAVDDLAAAKSVSPKGTAGAPTSARMEPLHSSETDGEERRAEKEIREVESALESRMECLRAGIGSLACSSHASIPVPKYIKSEINFSRLYSLIYHNRVKHYSDQVSAMITTMETLGCIDVEHVVQGVEYIDSKIMSRAGARQAVKYTSPLIRSVVPNLPRENIDSLIESMRMVQVSSCTARADTCGKAGSAFELRPSHTSRQDEKPAGGSGPAPSSSAGQPATLAPGVGRSSAADTGDFAAMRSTAVASNMAERIGDSGSAVPSEVSVRPSNGSPMIAQEKGPGAQPNTSSLFAGGASSASLPMFSSNPSAGPMQSSDTTSIFNNLSNAGSSIFNAAPPQDSASGAGQEAGSAFSRFAGSRRLFK